ncbi:MAG TPA: TRAP transporter small permease [Longimicrobiales bacterium]|nr:TRAP transporter small permease [Longimicrobiales bacterium]
MTRPAERSGGALDLLLRINAALAVVLFAALTVVVALQVLTRFVLHIPFIWSEEVARFLFFWTVLLGAAMSVRSRRHFVLDIGMGRRAVTGGAARVILDLVPHLCVLAFSVLLFVLGIDYARAGLLRTATNSNVDMGLVFAAVPVFAALTFVYTVGNLLADVRGLRSGRPPADQPAPGGE